MRLGTCALAALLLCCVPGSAARAAAPPPRLEWWHDGTCSAPTAELPRTQREPPDGRAPLRLRAEVRARSGGRYHLDFRARREGDERVRSLELASCEEARQAALLLAELALDEAARPADGSDAPTRSRDASASSPARWGLGALGGAAFVALPPAAPLAALELGLQLGFARLLLDAQYMTGRVAGDGLPQGASARLTVLSVAPAMCLASSESALGFGVCAQTALGRIQGAARNVARSASRHAPWLTVGGAGFVEYNLTHDVTLRLVVQAGATLRRPRFALEDRPPFYSVPPATVQTALGVFFWL